MRYGLLPLAIRRGSLGVKREIWFGFEQLRRGELTKRTVLLCGENLSGANSFRRSARVPSGEATGIWLN